MNLDDILKELVHKHNELMGHNAEIVRNPGQCDSWECFLCGDWFENDEIARSEDHEIG